MKQNQILDIWHKADAEYERIRAEFRCGASKVWRNRNNIFADWMQSNGFILVGSGMYSSVWRLGGRLFKINSNINGDNDGFYGWMKACMNNAGNPALPKFGDLMQIGQRYCVELEQLHPQYTINGPESLYKATRTNKHLMDAVVLAVETCAGDNDNGYKPVYTPGNITESLIERVLDVHSANVMRLNGQPVLNDPIACLNSPIPFVVVAQYA